jgi:hypothetical protein
MRAPFVLVLVRRVLTMSMLSCALVACAAPSSQATSGSDDGASTRPAPQAAPKRGQPVKMPPLGGPLPPERVQMPSAKPVQVDRSCRVDSDCVVKDVGNCCGYYPACVNKASRTDPAAVQAQCAKDGKASICGFPVIDGCRCVGGQCSDVPPSVEPSQDPPASDPVR